MRTDTQQTIYRNIARRNGATAKELIKNLGLYPTGIFRHLHHLQKKKLIYKVGTPPTVRYYSYANTMKHQSPLLTNLLNWAASGDPRIAPKNALYPTRDVFQARTDGLVHDLKKVTKNDNLAYLLVAIVGEIGNNAFDHNLGHWQDIPGIHFRHDASTREIGIADRGQGIYATIRRVKPTVRNEAEAARVAFTERISGRAPEKRGNGLKFVKKVIEENRLRLELYTGGVKAEITASGMIVQQSDTKIPGTLVYLQY